ncbi:MAG: hypothetical protein FWC58_02415 [Desulfobulbus sp.]|nr:hypothetical protein [Desulfobulbus sp.]
MQLDIFEHSHDVALRNDVVNALQQRDVSSARNALQILLRENPGDDIAPALSILLETLEKPLPSHFADHDALRDAYREMYEGICPAARRVFGDAASNTWLRAVWKHLAQAAEPLPLRRADADIHAAQLWLHAQDWTAAQHAIKGIESWQRIPETLAWMIEAQYRQQGLDAIWPLLAELAWLSPPRLDALVRHLTDKSLTALRRIFDVEFEGFGSVDDLAWFPAWVLIEKPALASFLATTQQSTQTPPERAMRLILNLLHLERGGRHHEMMACRKALQDVNRALFSVYMKTRT